MAISKVNISQNQTDEELVDNELLLFAVSILTGLF